MDADQNPSLRPGPLPQGLDAGVAALAWAGCLAHQALTTLPGELGPRSAAAAGTSRLARDHVRPCPHQRRIQVESTKAGGCCPGPFAGEREHPRHGCGMTLLNGPDSSFDCRDEWQQSGPCLQMTTERAVAVRPPPSHLIVEVRQLLDALPHRVRGGEPDDADMAVPQRRSAEETRLEGGVEGAIAVVAACQCSERVDLGMGDVAADDMPYPADLSGSRPSAEFLTLISARTDNCPKWTAVVPLRLRNRGYGTGTTAPLGPRQRNPRGHTRTSRRSHTIGGIGI